MNIKNKLEFISVCEKILPMIEVAIIKHFKDESVALDVTDILQKYDSINNDTAVRAIMVFPHKNNDMINVWHNTERSLELRKSILSNMVTNQLYDYVNDRYIFNFINILLLDKNNKVVYNFKYSSDVVNSIVMDLLNVDISKYDEQMISHDYTLAYDAINAMKYTGLNEKAILRWVGYPSQCIGYTSKLIYSDEKNQPLYKKPVSQTKCMQFMGTDNQIFYVYVGDYIIKINEDTIMIIPGDKFKTLFIQKELDSHKCNYPHICDICDMKRENYESL